MRHVLFRRAFALLALIGILHAAGAFLYLYWTVWWYDIAMHFLGGFWAALIVLWAYEWPELKRLIGSERRLLVALVGTAAIGAGWEVMEYFAGLTFVVEGYKLDTATDMVMDLLGASVAVSYASRLIAKRAKKNDGDA